MGVVGEPLQVASERVPDLDVRVGLDLHVALVAAHGVEQAGQLHPLSRDVEGAEHAEPLAPSPDDDLERRRPVRAEGSQPRTDELEQGWSWQRLAGGEEVERGAGSFEAKVERLVARLGVNQRERGEGSDRVARWGVRADDVRR